jgi:bifunctional DNA-binding transcriptional regulator/antitoxin component of YhaV-PrlF toxin-antitoxin module
MKTAIDASGRVLIPKKVREQAAFPIGSALTARYLDGSIVLEPAPMEIRIERRGSFRVAVPLTPVEPMDEAVVDSTLGQLRSERGA